MLQRIETIIKRVTALFFREGEKRLLSGKEASVAIRRNHGLSNINRRIFTFECVTRDKGTNSCGTREKQVKDIVKFINNS